MWSLTLLVFELVGIITHLKNQLLQYTVPGNEVLVVHGHLYVGKGRVHGVDIFDSSAF